jgi:hypothetical protein
MIKFIYVLNMRNINGSGHANIYFIFNSTFLYENKILLEIKFSKIYAQEKKNYF